MGEHFGLPTETLGGSASKRMRRLNGVFTRARTHVSGRARKRLKAPRAAVIRSPCRAEEASGWALFLRDTGSLASAQNFGLRAGPMPFSPGR